MSPVRINLGGEGEILGVINVQGPWVLPGPWPLSRDPNQTIQGLMAQGETFVIADFLQLPFADDSVDEVIMNSCPPQDTVTHLGPTVQSSEVRRILKSGGRWLIDGILHYAKP
jgi:methyltransferase family protein